jgi:hypothetical protein
MNSTILIVGVMLVMSLFGTKGLNEVLTKSAGFEVDSLRSISLVIAVLRLVSEMYDLVWKPKNTTNTTPSTSAEIFRQMYNTQMQVVGTSPNFY